MVGLEGLPEIEKGYKCEKKSKDRACWLGCEDLAGCGARLVVFFIVVISAGIEVWEEGRVLKEVGKIQ